MTNHDHSTCDHQMKFCATCDVAYCAKCGREWGAATAYTPRGAGDVYTPWVYTPSPNPLSTTVIRWNVNTLTSSPPDTAAHVKCT